MDVFGRYERDRILDTRANILDGEIGVVITDDLAKGNAFVKQFEDALYRNACTSDTGFPKMDFRVNNDSFHNTILPQLRNAVHTTGTLGVIRFCSGWF